MLSINPQNVIYQLHYSKVEPGFLFGNYELESISPLTGDEFLEALSPTIQIHKRIDLPTPWKPIPYIIGDLYNAEQHISPLFYLRRSATKLFHASIESYPKKHLLLIEHSFDDQFLDITVIHRAAVSGLWGRYTQAWEEGLLNEKIDELKKQIIPFKIGE